MQRCTSTTRVVINQKIYDEFIGKLKKIYENVKIGNPLENGVLVGPLIDNDAVSNYFAAIETAKNREENFCTVGANMEMEIMSFPP